MIRSMITATNTMTQLQKQMDTISHNIANINTVGFKRRETSFNELLFQQLNNQPIEEKEIGRLTPFGIRQGVGAKLAQTQLILSQGAVQSTERPLDIAFTKENQFLQVLVKENGVETIRYTRNGALYLSPLNDGTGRNMLVTGDGYPVLDANQEPIYIQENYHDIHISETGVIKVEGEIPQTFELGVVRFQRPQLLESIGENMYGLPNLQALNLNEGDVLIYLNGELRREVAIQQGALEQSNVNLTQEMTDLLTTQRSYQMNAKSITLADQMMGLINGIR
jgi:flagellar basal-body rod protein FlgG